LVTLSKTVWSRGLDSVVIQLYAGECTPSVDRALNGFCVFLENDHTNLRQFFSRFRRKHVYITTCIKNTAPAFKPNCYSLKFKIKAI